MLKVNLFLILMTFVFQAQAVRLTCEERYNAAKIVCQDLRNSCDQAVICKNIRNECPQSVSDMSSCESFTQCALQKTPTIYRNSCTYSWAGHPSKGICENNNRVDQNVTLSCPGVALPLSAFNDPKFNCSGQVKRYLEQKNICNLGIRDYQSNCAQDIDRPSIRVRECPQGDTPLPIAEDTVTAENRVGANVSRTYSQLISGEKLSQSPVSSYPATSTRVMAQ